jgi:hypothetical protein
MRYIVLGLNRKNMKEIVERKRYIEHTFGLYVIPFYNKQYVEFKSIPLTECDLLMIIGHNYLVYDYLNSNKPSENNIVLVTCYTGIIKQLLLPNKKVYVSKNEDGYTQLYNGAEWNINFKISDSELELYNSDNKFNLTNRLEESFERVNCDGKNFRKNK